MKNTFTKIFLAATISFALSGAVAQNVALNMLVLNSGNIPLAGNGTLQATVNASTGTAGQVTPVPAGKINVSISVPPSVLISSTQTNLPAGWTVRFNDGTAINICNSSTTIPVNTAVDLLIDLQGVTVTTGAPTMSGNLTFRTNCAAPGSLSGDNPSDNSGQAGFSVTGGTVPLRLTNFNATIVNCQPALNWTTENEINSDRFEIERNNQNSANWLSVGVVASSGNGPAKVNYNFTDNNLPVSSEKVLYRLKIIDRNGQYKYSPILPVFINCKTAQVYAYPNPVQNGSLYISLTGATGNTDAALFSLSGQVILKKRLNNGTNLLNVSKIANGEYVMRVNFENGTYKKVKVLIHN